MLLNDSRNITIGRRKCLICENCSHEAKWAVNNNNTLRDYPKRIIVYDSVHSEEKNRFGAKLIGYNFCGQNGQCK